MKYMLINTTESFAVAASTNGAAYNVGSEGCDSISFCGSIVDNTPTTKTFGDTGVNTTTDVITTAANGYYLGLKVRFTTTGTLPSGISLATDYFIIPVSATTFKIATSLANAQAGTAVDITSQSSAAAVNTITATPLAGATIKLQQANSSSGPWLDLGTATTITGSMDVYLEKDRPTSHYVRAVLTLTAGSLATTLQVLGKGDKE